VTAVVRRIVEVQGIPMSALVAEAPEPRAVIVALHGGASTSVYFDCPNVPRLSLLRTGAALGFTVVALDRPGYGSSASHAAGLAPAARRVDLAYAAVDRLLESESRGAGMFLIGHSIGCELTVRMAADERGAGLLGIELAGTGRRHSPAAEQLLQTWQRNPDRPRKSGLSDLLWQPSRLYPAEVVGGATIAARGPAYEADVAHRWAPHDFAGLAALIRVPVHFSIGEYEMVWRSGRPALAEIGAMFTSASRVVVEEQPEGGHNLSLGLTAMAYHLKVLSFVEECAVDAMQRTAGEVK
jgi:pimeloyl-ACP methyl ester carboxylesterase